MISVIIPVLNEASGIKTFLGQPLFDDQVVECIFVDGGSTDNTKSLILEACKGHAKVLDSTAGRAEQMNAGARLASGQILLFVHADTRLPAHALDLIQAHHERKWLWGRFDVSLNAQGISYQVISWFINWRSRLSGIATGDQAMFVSREAFQAVKGFPDQKLMEDIALSKKLKRLNKPVCLKAVVKTSARKWQKEGIVKTVLKMWYLRAAYALGADPDRLFKIYYGLNKQL